MQWYRSSSFSVCQQNSYRLKALESRIISYGSVVAICAARDGGFFKVPAVLNLQSSYDDSHHYAVCDEKPNANIGSSDKDFTQFPKMIQFITPIKTYNHE